jgi:hypothetical protein
MGRPPAYRVGRSDSRVTGTAGGASLDGMLTILEAVVGALFAALRPRASLVAENLVLRRWIPRLAFSLLICAKSPSARGPTGCTSR